MNSGTNEPPPPPRREPDSPEKGEWPAPHFAQLIESDLADFLDVVAPQPNPQPKPPKPKPKSRAKRAERKIEAVALRAVEDQIKRNQDNHDQLMKMRDKYGKCAMLIVVLWQFWIQVIIVLNGVGWVVVSDNVMIVLLSTTTANVFGLLLIVMRFAFPMPSRSPTRKSKNLNTNYDES